MIGKKQIINYYNNCAKDAEVFNLLEKNINVIKKNDVYVGQQFQEILDIISSVKNDEEKGIYKDLLKYFTLEEINNLVRKKGEVSNEMLEKVRLVSFASGANTTLNAYGVQELVELNKQMVIKDYYRLLYTLRVALLNESKYEYARQAMALLSIILSDKKATITKISITISQIFLLAWSAFDYLSEEEQSQLFKNYFLLAISANVDIYNDIKKVISETPGFFNYLSKHSNYVKWLEGSNEEVSINNKDILLKNLFVSFYTQFKTAPKISANKYLEKYFSKTSSNDAILISVLSAGVNIYESLKTASLVKYNDKLYMSGAQVDLIQVDLTQLFEWFLDKSLWPKIVDYFKNEKSLVNLDVFMSYCYYDFELTEKTAVLLLDFFEILKKNKIIDSDKEYLVFHESDNQFHWNEEVLK